MRKTVGIVALSSFVSLSASAAEPTGQPEPVTIRVVTRATVSVKPDQAELEVGVTSDKKTAAAAVAENAHKMEQVVAALKKELGSDGELQSSDVGVRQRFEERSNGESTGHLLGYTVTNTVRIRTANTRSIGRLLDAAFQAGANTTEYVKFGLKNPEAAQNDALRAASAKARARATAIADGQGLRVGDVVSVTEGDKDGVGWASDVGGLRSRAAANMTIEPGALDVNGVVTVVFALKAR